jgi:acyl carrier protein
MDTAARVREVVADVFGLYEDEIQDDNHIADDFAADGLDLIGLADEIEHEFGIFLDDEEAEDLANMTVGGLINYVNERLSE